MKNAIGFFIFILCEIFLDRIIIKSAPALAQPQIQSHLHSVTLTSDTRLPSSRWMYDKSVPLPKNSSSVVKLLRQVRENELQNRGEQCLSGLEQLKKTARDLHPWLAISALNCANKVNDKGQNRYLALLSQSHWVDKNEQWLLLGPQVNGLRLAYVRALMQMLENEMKTNRRQAWSTIDRLLKQRAWADVTQLSQIYRSAGELAFMQQNLNLALSYFNRSYQSQPSDEMRQKINALAKSLNKEKEEVKASVNVMGAVVSESKFPDLEASEKEINLYQRVVTAMSGGDLLAAVEDSIQLIQQFPGGKRSDWASARVIEILLNIVSGSDAKFRLLKQRILEQMEKADGMRIADWAKTLFAKGYYIESLRLASASLNHLSGKALTQPLSIVAQSSVFLGDYKKSEQYFNQLIEEHAGTDFSVEGLFRLGLVFLRQQKYSLAVGVFERLLALPRGKPWEMQARYWLWRSLEKSKSDRANGEMKTLIEKFPLTYYGLRARFESNNNRLFFDKDLKGPIKIEMWLTEREHQAWERFQILLQAGWLKEAQGELSLLPAPQTAEEKILRARLFAFAFDHYSAIVLINEAWEENKDFMRSSFYPLAFPQEFQTTIKKYTSKQELSPLLVMSLIKQESSFRPDAVSPSNAVGLMQIVPITARDSAQYLNYKKKLNLPDDLMDPEINIQFGTSYLKRMLRAFDSHLPLALASYNLGIGRLRRWLSYRQELSSLVSRPSRDPLEEIWIDELPWAETSFYVKAVLRNYLVYRALDKGTVDMSSSLWDENVSSGL